MSELTPGMLVVVLDNTMVRRMGSEEEHWTPRSQHGLIVQKSHQWHEAGRGDEVLPDYLVLFSNDSRMYYVPGDRLCTLDAFHDPSRLFGRLSS